MMDDSDKNSRVNKYKKRRKNTKKISVFLVLGVILVIVLLGVWMFGGSDEETDKSESPTEQENDNGQAKTDDPGNDKNDTGDEEGSGDNDSDNDETNQDNDNDDEDAYPIPSDDVDLEEIDKPDDDNVEKAYKGDWEPIGTSQSEPHEVQYDTDSEDWKEMEEAIRDATGLSDDMTVYRIGNGGSDQKAVGTVSDPDQENIYRVSIEWQGEEGYQPTKVEILKEVDESSY